MENLLIFDIYHYPNYKVRLILPNVYNFLNINIFYIIKIWCVIFGVVINKWFFRCRLV